MKMIEVERMNAENMIRTIARINVGKTIEIKGSETSINKDRDHGISLLNHAFRSTTGHLKDGASALSLWDDEGDQIFFIHEII